MYQHYSPDDSLPAANAYTCTRAVRSSLSCLIYYSTVHSPACRCMAPLTHSAVLRSIELAPRYNTTSDTLETTLTSRSED
eukprot:5000887-Pyramimonas_sp.AAC.2